MKILGVDPGVNRVGYGLVEGSERSQTVLRSGAIVPAAGASYEKKILAIIEKFDVLMDETAPDIVAVEEIYLGKNVRIALKIGQVTGVIIGSAIRKGTGFCLLPAREIKQSITGQGSATKEQVQFMIEHMTGHKGFKSLDESDAVAAAVAYLHYKKEHDLLHSGQTGL
ncbi:MAG: crossover junction endodeoxyribonuclease RuvC [Candidatus Omnitrophica bacterium]|nr:crossover junction endodeoxyribonuclease RuvC [Candidatus Omnitrophota bacterium]